MIADQSIGLLAYAELFNDKSLSRRIRMRVAANSDDYEGFVVCLYEDIDNIFSTLQSSPYRRSNDGEDRITDELISNLTTAGYDATHDQDAGGHVDVTVKLGGLTWIGEAKIYRTPSTAYEGFLQLTTRYRPASGNFAHNKGGMLLYITDKPNAKSHMDAWRLHLKNKFIEGYTDENCLKNNLAFYSEHIHEVTGLPFYVRHIPLLLYHEPKDKSARSRKNKSPTK